MLGTVLGSGGKISYIYNYLYLIYIESRILLKSEFYFHKSIFKILPTTCKFGPTIHKMICLLLLCLLPTF